MNGVVKWGVFGSGGIAGFACDMDARFMSLPPARQASLAQRFLGDHVSGLAGVCTSASSGSPLLPDGYMACRK